MLDQMFPGSFGFISRIRPLKSSEECLGKQGQNSEGNGTSLAQTGQVKSVFACFSQVARGATVLCDLLPHFAEVWQKK